MVHTVSWWTSSPVLTSTTQTPASHRHRPSAVAEQASTAAELPGYPRKMQILGTVSSEGGPFSWRTRSQSGPGGGHDYARLCAALDHAPPAGMTWHFGNCAGVVWSPGGPGTAHLVQLDAASLVIVRGWFDGDNEGWEAAVLECARIPRANADSLGAVKVPSGVLVVLWAPEDGECVTAADVARGSGGPTGDVAINGSSCLARLPTGEYVCEVEVGQPRPDSSRSR